MTRRGLLFTISAGLARAAAAPLPKAITSLPNRRGEAHPITRAEREGRLERARVLMRANRLDGMVLAGGTSLEYFTGIRWGNSERLFAFVLPRAGNPSYVCPAFEQDRLQEQTGAAPLGSESKVLPWQEDEDPYWLVSRALSEAGVRTGRVGIEERVPFVFADEIHRHWKLLEFAYVRVGNCRIKQEIDLSTPVRIAGTQIWLVFDESQELLEGQYLFGMQRGHFAHQFAVDMFVAGFAEHHFVAPGRNEARVRIAYDAEPQEVRGRQDMVLGLLIEI